MSKYFHPEILSLSLDSTTNQKIEQIIQAFDANMMLGAAWDCLSEKKQDIFKVKLSLIIEGS